MVVANKVDGGENATIPPDEGFRGEITKTKQRNPLWDSKKWKNIFRTAYSPQKLHKSDENMNKTTKNSLKTEKQTIFLKIKIYMLINSRWNFSYNYVNVH